MNIGDSVEVVGRLSGYDISCGMTPGITGVINGRLNGYFDVELDKPVTGDDNKVHASWYFHPGQLRVIHDGDF